MVLPCTLQLHSTKVFSLINQIFVQQRQAWKLCFRYLEIKDKYSQQIIFFFAHTKPLWRARFSCRPIIRLPSWLLAGVAFWKASCTGKYFKNYRGDRQLSIYFNERQLGRKCISSNKYFSSRTWWPLSRKSAVFHGSFQTLFLPSTVLSLCQMFCTSVPILSYLHTFRPSKLCFQICRKL